MLYICHPCTDSRRILLAELQALEFEEDRVEYEEVEQTTPDGIALMAQWRALKAACDALSPVGRYKVASVSYRKCVRCCLRCLHCKFWPARLMEQICMRCRPLFAASAEPMAGLDSLQSRPDNH